MSEFVHDRYVGFFLGDSGARALQLSFGSRQACCVPSSAILTGLLIAPARTRECPAFESCITNIFYDALDVGFPWDGECSFVEVNALLPFRECDSLVPCPSSNLPLSLSSSVPLVQVVFGEQDVVDVDNQYDKSVSASMRVDARARLRGHQSDDHKPPFDGVAP